MLISRTLTSDENQNKHERPQTFALVALGAYRPRAFTRTDLYG